MTNAEDREMRADPVDGWLRAAVADAERRGLPELKPMLESLAESTRRLRAAEWSDHVPADGRWLKADDGATRRDRPENA